jgi:hypothetical protein
MICFHLSPLHITMLGLASKDGVEPIKLESRLKQAILADL